MKTVKDQLDALRHSLDLLEQALVEDDLESPADDPPIPVDRMLQWQRIGDEFYNTIQHYLGCQLIGIGQYDMPTGLILRLTDGIGLQILPDYNRIVKGEKAGHPVGGGDFLVSLNLRFVKLPDLDDNWLGEPLVDPGDGWVSSGEAFQDAPET